MKPTPKQYEDAHARQKKIVEHLIEEGYAENEESANQIQNRNFLSPIGFKFTITKTPKVDFFCNSARIPEIILGTAIQPSYLKDIDVPGDKLQYGDFSLRFLVDEELQNYMSIHNWLTGLGYPETPKEHQEAVDRHAKIVEHLIDEGYAEDQESADKIIMGMSEQWFNLIID